MIQLRGVTKGNWSLTWFKADNDRSIRGLGMDKMAFERSHEILNHSKRWTGILTDLPQLGTKPALTESDRTMLEQRCVVKKSNFPQPAPSSKYETK